MGTLGAWEELSQGQGKGVGAQPACNGLRGRSELEMKTEPGDDQWHILSIKIVLKLEKNTQLGCSGLRESCSFLPEPHFKFRNLKQTVSG